MPVNIAKEVAALERICARALPASVAILQTPGTRDIRTATRCEGNGKIEIVASELAMILDGIRLENSRATLGEDLKRHRREHLLLIQWIKGAEQYGFSSFR